jgi:hypothetical protein
LKIDDVVMAFIFGSWAKGRGGIESDMDIAVYFRSMTNALEWEADNYYDSENSIWFEIEKIVQREVDLLVLNRVSPTVASRAIEGIPILINFLEYPQCQKSNG